MQLTVPPAELTTALFTTYLRLELDENHRPESIPPTVSQL